MFKISLLSILLGALLFGESESFYKAKYDYLFKRLQDTERNIINKEIENLGRQLDADEKYQNMQDITMLNKDKNELSDKIMDIKFKMQEDLKTIPTWFTFDPK